MRQPLSARDFKHGSRRGGASGLAKYRQFATGLGIGLAVALYVWAQGQRSRPAEPTQPVAAAVPEIAAADQPDPLDQLDFYDMLPRFEVEVPEEKRNARSDGPSVAIAKPGAYVLQTDSFQNRREAERQRDRLIKQGIDASIQHVTIDEREWHRVIIGPSRDLAYINSMREALRAAQVTFRIYQIGE